MKKMALFIKKAAVLLVCVCSAFANVHAQNIARVEYFIDTDPGFGSGTAVSISQGQQDITANFSVNISAVSDGFHNLYVRSFATPYTVTEEGKTVSKGGWSLASVRSFYKESIATTTNTLPNITGGEYFIDTDPGFGKGQPVSITPGTDLTNVSFNVNISNANIATGFHNLFMRFRDANGRWSQTNVRTFYKEDINTTSNTLPNITGGEYFIDNDPGHGKGQSISITPGTDLTNVSFNVNISNTSIAAGFHNLYVRFRDANGRWSQANVRSFYKEQLTGATALPNVVALEYFVDTDPGVGKGKKVNVTPSTNITSFNFPVDMSDVSIGNHKIYVRALDAAGKWSLVSSGDFKVEAPSEIYITIGKLPESLCSGVAFGIPFTVNTSYGSNNVFTAQLSDASGNFASPVNVGTLSSGNSGSINATLPANTAAGNGYRIRIIASSPLDTSAAGATITVLRLPDQAFSISGPSQACTGSQTYSISNIAPNTTYTWSLSEGGTLTDNGSSATVNWATPGTHTLTVTPSNSCGNGQARTLQVIISSGTPTITASGPLNFCESGSVVLTSSAASGNTWSTGATTQSITVTQSGTYTVTTGGTTCTATSEEVIVTVTANTIPTFNAIAPFCAGTQAPTLPASSVNGIAGTWSPAVISNMQSGTYTFTPTSATGCIASAQLPVTVMPAITPAFNAIPDITPGGSVPPLPATSLNGVSGTWSPAVISNTQSGSYTFTPVGTPCAVPVTINVVVRTAVDLAVQNVSASQTAISSNDQVTVSWNVANTGSAQSLIDWTEKIYLQSTDGTNRTLLKQTTYNVDGVIAVNQNIARSSVVTIPAQLAVGDQAVFVVEIVPGATVQEIAGTQANNTGVQATPVSIRKMLSVSLSATQITEGTQNGISVTVSRTGSLAGALTVNIATDLSGRYTIPSTLTIPANQAAASFTIGANENNATEGPLQDTVRITASGFASAKAGFTLLDNDNPTLTISNLPAETTEGNTVTFRISTSLAPSAALTVYLTSGNQKRFPLPATVTIAAGATYVDVPVALVQDSIPEISESVSIAAGAANHISASASILVNDDDVPGLELVIQTNTIAESAGYYATQATLRRISGSNSIAFTASLSASISNTLILPQNISLAKGENEKTFYVGVLDNTQAEGDRQVIITASVFVSSCGCSAPPSSSGSVSATIKVTDDDGPALILSANPLTLAEGLTNAGTLRITRNTATTQALTVNLSSSNTGEATVPATATIAAGSAFVEVPITTINDGVADGNKQVYFNATASGLSTGSVWIVVTDQNKPDLQITSATVSNSTLQAMALLNYRLSVKNTGLATAPSGLLVRGYLSKNTVLDDADTLLTEYTITSPIAVGETVQVVDAAGVPNLPGGYYLIFKVNPLSDITELLLTNNTSQPVAVTINPDYTATASVANAYYLQGTAVAITGHAVKSNGTAAGNVAVDVYVINNGYRKTIAATTNAQGDFSTVYTPLTNEAGHYMVSAGYPGTNTSEEQDAFDILGVRINSGAVPQFKVTINDTLRGSLQVVNLSNQALNDFTIDKISVPGGASIHFDTIQTLAGNATASIGYEVSGSSISPGTVFSVAGMNAVSREGTIQPLNIFYFCQAPNGYVEADISSIDVSISPAAGEKSVQFKLINKGNGYSGDIKLSLPNANWLNSVTPVNISSLAPGDTTTVVLKFSALDEVPFNYTINGTIAVNTQNGNSFSIPFAFRKVSATTGDVKVVATDQFTYYTEGGPNVAGAHVTIKNYYTGEIYAEGNTDNSGIFLATGVPEGTHKIVVSKEKHLDYTNTLTINPGNTITHTAFLNYQAITYSWTVVPTAIQDEYDITLTAQFETNVPAPVVTIEMPKTMPQLSGNDSYAFNAILTNHGLIAAEDVTLNLPTDNEYEFITNYTPARLLAQQSIQVPIIMRRKAANGGSGRLSYSAISDFLGIAPPSARTNGGPGNCTAFTGVVYWYKCNLSTGLWQQGGALFTYQGRVCDGGGGGGTGDGILIGSGNFPYNGNGVYYNIPCVVGCGTAIGGTSSTAPQITEKKSCVDCLNDLTDAISDCFDIPPPVKCFPKTLIQNGGPKEYVLCLIEETIPSLEDIIEEIASKIPYVDKLLCLKKLLEALATCLASAEESRVSGVSQRKGELGNVGREFYDNLKVVEKSYKARVDWNTEYFGELSTSDGWKQLSAMITPNIESLTAFSLQKRDSIIEKMSGYDVSTADLLAFFTRWNASIEALNNNILEPNAQYPGIINWKLAKSYSDALVDAHNYAVNKDFATVEDMHAAANKGIQEIIDNQKNAVCASVTVQLSQKLTMTREAFKGTLEIFNGHPTDKMDSLTVNILITDENGVPSNGLFEIQTKSLTNLSNVTGTGNIAAQQKGSVEFLFIPEIGAAPTAPKLYRFGGSIRYFDPYAQAMVTMPLSDVELTVNPSPNLYLHYFMQRNILGDDALTSPKIEPSIPAELAVLVENQGYGPAVNMLISSAQPKIIENEKGLAINFNLIGSNFQGQPKNLGVTDINFGTVPALESRVGEWYFTSSLLGKFVSYDAKVVHNNSFGNPDLSLVKGIKLHELTKSIREYGTQGDGINDFLVNDLFDVHDVPDMIYFSQGMRTAKVYEAASGSFSSPVYPPSFTNTLTVTASATGWNYIKLNDPGSGHYELKSVTRSDGQVIPLDNAWLTFVTLPVSQAPVYEDKFHFVDSFPSTSPVTYTVIWKPKATNVPEILEITGPPEAVTSQQVQQVTVVFNKAIDSSTFNYQDLSLTFQGGPNIINSSVTVTQTDTATFVIDLSSVTTGNGFYNLTVQAADIADIYGINGTDGRNITWSQFLTVPAVQAFLALPESRIASAYDTIQVLFNLPIDITTVTPERFTILKDNVAQPGSITIDSIRADHKLFYLSGLGAILTQNGEYEFVVDLPNIKSEDQEPGVQTQSVKLTVDNTGPSVVSIDTSHAGGLDPQHVTFVNIKFNENVYGFNVSSVTLTRNGEVVYLNIAQLSNTDLKTWMAGNFGTLTYPDGEYTFTVNTSGFTDAAGNHGSSSQQVTWTVNHAALVNISNLKVTPDLGYSATDGITSGLNLEATFSLSNNASQVTVSQTDLSGENILTTLSNVAAGNITVPVTLIAGGNTGIKVTATGAGGGSDTAGILFYTDQLPLSGKWNFTSGQTLASQPDTISLSFSSKLLNDADLANAVALKKDGAAINNASLQFSKINDTAYYVYGIRSASTNAANYSISINLSLLKKYLSGLAGAGEATVLWNVVAVNRQPVANAGADITITAPGTYTLNGSASSDPEGDQLSYEWTAPEGVELTGANTATPSFTVTAAHYGKTFTFLLAVSDGNSFSTDIVQVNITAPTAEICDGIDNDGDGEVDEGFDKPNWYRDEDGDGYGNPEIVVQSCTQPAGYVSDNTDKNDKDNTVYPGAPELCDGKDNDGDGEVDEDCTATSGTYYSKPAGDLHTLPTWGTNADGSGTAPSDFGDGKTFTLANRGNVYTLTGNWSLTGTLHIPSGAQLAINGNTLSLAVLTGTGTVSGSATSSLAITGTGDFGTLNFSSGNGGSLKALTVDRNGSVTIGTALSIYDILTVNNGTLGTGDQITLKSNADNTARVTPVAGNIIGSVTVERYIPARRAWRLMSAPVAGDQSINAAWQEGVTLSSPNPNPYPGYGTIITKGSAADGFDQNLPGQAYSILSYDNATDTWKDVTNTRTNAVNKIPYFLFVRGDRTVTTTGTKPTTLRVTGPLKLGDQRIPTATNGYTAVANPFASPINFATITRNNVDNSFYLWDPKVGGTYGVGAYVNISFNGTGYDMVPKAISPESQYIQSGQGFLVHSSGNAGSIVIKESDKSATPARNVFKAGEQTGDDDPVFVPAKDAYGIRISLQTGDTAGYSVLDEVFTSYSKNFEDKIDGMDVKKLYNVMENISLNRKGNTLMVERRSPINDADTIYLKLDNTKEKNYMLEFNPEALKNVVSAVLVDNYMHSTVAVSTEEITQVHFVVNGDATSSGANRFMLVLTRKGAQPVQPSVKAYPNPVTDGNIYLQFSNIEKGAYYIELTSSVGQVVVRKIIHHTGENITHPVNIGVAMTSGIYQLRITGDHFKTIVKLFKK
ncbi:MAG: T9SS type A sorting domain-containing protein [Sphingobacteriales bacterium]|nr:T9SS type A sorting domain-containing protein [Sphingobacteriales bacterium]